MSLILDLAFRIGWFLFGWSAAFILLLACYLGCQIYLGSRR